ncbi:MAG: hemerythrin domain-containing protein [Nitrososphaerota archaeon]
MQLEILVNEILREHVDFINEWNSIREIINQVSFEEPKIRKDKFNFLKPLTDLFGRTCMFVSKFKIHEIKEEKYIFIELAERGKKELVFKLLDEHRKLDNMLEEMRKLLENYRFEKISARELAEQMLKIHKEITDTIMKHIEIEDEEFPKLG